MTTLSKQLATIAMALGIAVGCATKPTQQQAPAQQAAPDQAQQQEQEAAAKAAAEAAARENQRLLDESKGLFNEAQQFTGLNADQAARLREAEAALAAGDGRKAYDILNGLLAELRAARMTYAVVRGDSLWRIAGKSEVYGNPYQWPLIYKMNADKIKDADLIYPGQEFTVNKAPTKAEADAAVQHAKTRGAWSIGAVEASDQAYLAR
ncbi:MAG TPA: LysM peptidoglycan-binding domain-containing protein [Gammaproteobacteria bacterium]|nr:LysM peptidoglycan-binding domain-containing protein [Gammaproteobacteria bacterium]